MVAGTFACVYVLALMEAATRMLMSQGRLLTPGAACAPANDQQTLDNFERVGPVAAWTGPMARGDFSTWMCSWNSSRKFLDAYKTLLYLTAGVLATKPGAVVKQLERIYHAAEVSKKNKHSNSKAVTAGTAGK